MKKLMYVLTASLFLAGYILMMPNYSVAQSNQPGLPGPPNQPGEENETTGELIHFFFFGSDLPNNTELESIDAVFSTNTTAELIFLSSLEGYPDTDRDGAMERTNRPTELNYRPEGNNNIPFANSGMRAIQVKQPFEGPNGENTMVFNMSTAGFEDIVLTLAAMDEGAAEGLIFDYSIVSGDPVWITTGLDAGEINQSLETDTYQVYTVDFTGIEEAANNPNFKVRVRFDVEDGTENDGERVTFNNVALDGAPFSGLTTYYYDGTGDLTNIASWGRNEDGTGDNPVDFTSDSQIFVVDNNAAAATLSSAWEVSGSGSRVIVAEGRSLIVQAAFDALVDVKSDAVLQLENADQPDLGSAESGSTVIFSGDAVQIPYTTFGNLVIDNINPVFSGDGDITVTGNLSLEGAVTMPRSRGFDEYEFFFTGSGNQVISANGNIFRSYEISVIKSEGSFELDAGNGGTTISTDSQLTFNISGSASLADNGQTIYAGNSVNIDGDGSYDFTGTLILAGTEEGIVNGSGDDNNFNIRDNDNDSDNPVAELNNIIVRVANTDGQFRFRDGSTDVFTIKGDFIVESGADGRIRFYDNEVFVGGDFIIEDGFAGSVDSINKLTMNGTDAQTFDSSVADFDIFVLNNPLGMSLSGTLFINDELVFESGIISVETDALLQVGADAEITGVNEDRFINGSLTRAAAQEGDLVLEYPLGTDTYWPAALFLDHNTDDEVTYTLEALSADDFSDPPFELPDGYNEFFGEVYYAFDYSDNAVLNSANIALQLPDEVENPEELRILLNGASIGGSVTGSVILSTEGFTSSGFLAVARIAVDETKEITSFVFEDFTPEIVGVIDQELLTITATVPVGTDVTELVPTIEFTGADLNPASGVAQDFSEPVTYTVTAQDGSEAEYTATVIIADPVTYELTLNTNISGAAVLDGEGTFEVGESVTVSVSPNTGFIFEGWFDDETQVSTDLEYTFEMPENDLHLTANFETAEREELAYFWFFGNDVPNNTELEFINPVFPEDTDATLEFMSSLEGYPDTDRRGSMERRNRPTELNYRPDGNQDIQFEDSEMRGIQITQPFEGPNGENTMIFHMPSVGFENLLFSFAAKDEGAAEGLFIEYSVSADNPEWTNELLSESDSYKPLMTDQYQLYFVDFSDIEEAANNEHFKVRIRFDVPNGEAEDGNRVTFNNVALEGNEVDAPVIPDAPTLVSPENEATDVEDFVFIWDETENTDSYTMQISASDDFEDVFAEVGDIEDNMIDVTDLVDFEELTTYFWRVRAVNENGSGEWSAVWSFTTAMFTSVEPGEDLPRKISLSQNYPNPFNPTTQISYDLPESADVRLEVYNIQGQLVAILANELQSAGTHTVTFDAQNLASGVYLYRLQAGSTVHVKKMTLVK